MKATPGVWTALLAGYAAIVVLMLAPVTNFGAYATAIAPGDAKLLAWTFAWTSHAIFTGTPLFDANVYYPTPHALAYMEHHVGVGIWGLPLFALTGNATLVYSVLLAAGLTLNALAMHVFAWRWFRSHAPALVAGLVFGVSSSRLISSPHVPLIWTCWLPVILLTLERWFATRQWRWMGAAVAAFVLQALVGWYLALMAGLMVLLFAGWSLCWPRLRPGRLVLAQMTVGALLAAALIWPFARPYLALAGREEAPPELALRYSADLGSYLYPPEHALAGPAITRATGLPARKIGAERSQYLGLVAAILAAFGVASLCWRLGRRNTDTLLETDSFWGGFSLILAAVAFAFSLGPSFPGSMPRLFDLVSSMPAVGMFRVPARFSVLVALAVAALAALGIDRIRHLAPKATLPATALLVALMLADWAVVPPVNAKPQPDPTPPIYRLLRQAGAHAVVSLPCHRHGDWPLDADYMLYSTSHWLPIVNGYGRSQPRDYSWVVGAADAFPGPNSAAVFRRVGVDHVVLHAGRYPDGARAILDEVSAGRDYRMVAHDGNDYVFQVLPARQ